MERVKCEAVGRLLWSVGMTRGGEMLLQGANLRVAVISS